MRLQSLPTVRLGRDELRRLARASRPRGDRTWMAWAGAGALAGALILAALRLL